jgi:hypothetical protein
MDKVDISLTLAAFSALAVLIGPIAALVAAAFVAGVLVGRNQLPSS